MGPGDRVALLCGNGRFFVDAYLATVGLGAVAVPLNPTSPAPEIDREIAAVGAKVVVRRPGRRSGMVGGRPHRVPDASSTWSPPRARVRRADSASPTLLAAEPVAVVDVDPDDLAVLIFTSGTAGTPRAAMLSHGNLLANIEQSRSDPGERSADDVVFGVLPLFHIFGLNVVLGIVPLRGATVVLVQRFDPSTALDTIRDRKRHGDPRRAAAVVAFSHFDDAPADASPRCASRSPVRRRCPRRPSAACTSASGWSSPRATASPRPHRSSPVGRLGDPARLGRPGGRRASRCASSTRPATTSLAGDAGEIWVQGPNVFQGYLDDPEQTAQVLTADGWLRTGDIAVTDDDGYLYLVDRAKDLIIVSGFNVYPAEVEDVLAEHPAVAEVGVIGVPHPHTGEAVKAFVVAAPRHASTRTR